jgi:hypothetical protein
VATVEPIPSFTVYEVAQMLRETPAEVLQRSKAAKARAAERRAHPKRVRPSANPRVAAYRLRQKIGMIVLRLEVEECVIATFLIDSGRLTAAESMVRPLVEKAVAQVLVDLAQRWSADHRNP